MNKEDMVNILIDRLMDVRRVKKAQDRDAELDNQEKILLAKLEAIGIVTTKIPE